MTFRSITHIRERHYLYEKETYWDDRSRSRKQRVVRYLGPCDKQGNLLAEPRPRVDHVQSAFPMGRLALFTAISQELRIVERAEEMGLDGLVVRHFLCLALNQMIDRLARRRLASWVRASPLPTWLSIPSDTLTPTTYDGVLSAVCHHDRISRHMDNRGPVLQDAWNRAWRGSSREPAAAYYDITKQRYYGTHCSLAQMGHDSERGLSTVVGFGLVVSREHHHPLFCRPLPGGRNDVITVRETVKELEAMDFRGLTMIMDRGMVSEENVNDVVEAGYHQVGIVRAIDREKPKGAWGYLARWPGKELERARWLVKRPTGEGLYARAFTAPLYGRPLRLTVVEAPEWRAEEKSARDLLLWELEGGSVPDERRSYLRQLLKPVVRKARGRWGFEVDRKAVGEEEARDGRFLMFSTNLSLEASEMFRMYFERDVVEKCFRTAKEELDLGAIHVRREDRLEAYATVIYLALLLWTWGERRLKEALPRMPQKFRKKYPSLTLWEALRLLDGISWVRFASGKRVRDWTTQLNGDQEALYRALGVTRLLPVT